MIRFNEAIDQAIAESISTFAHDVNETRDRFLAILGHDLRTPIGAIIMSAEFMREVAPLPEPQLSLATRIGRSARRMNQMVTDLLEFTRTRFGDSIPVVATEIDLRTVVDDAAAEARDSYASLDLQVSMDGDLRGYWDRARLTQALINLLGNAAQHGDTTHPVLLEASRTGDEVLMRVHNRGTPIPEDDVSSLFDPMKGSARGGRDRRHLGLGLFIVDRIAKAHGGEVEVESTRADGTTFTIHLPVQSGVPGARPEATPAAS